VFFIRGIVSVNDYLEAGAVSIPQPRVNAAAANAMRKGSSGNRYRIDPTMIM